MELAAEAVCLRTVWIAGCIKPKKYYKCTYENNQ